MTDDKLAVTQDAILPVSDEVRATVQAFHRAVAADLMADITSGKRPTFGDDNGTDGDRIHQAFARFEAQARLAGERAGENDLRAALEPVMHWYQSDEHPERPLVEIVADVVADLQEDRAFVLNPPKHKYWKPGEPDCPHEIKAGNGELHTLRCKVCGQDGPRDDFCRAAILKEAASITTGS